MCGHRWIARNISFRLYESRVSKGGVGRESADTLRARGDVANANDEDSQKRNNREKKKTAEDAETETAGVSEDETSGGETGKSAAEECEAGESKASATNKAAPKRAVATRSVARRSTATKASKSAAAEAAKSPPPLEETSQVTVVKKLLKKVEQKLTSNDAKASLGDYFPNDGAGTNFSGMPFYDAWNRAQFQAQYGHAMATITTNTVDPASYPDEAAFLPAVIGNFTSAVMSHVRGSHANCRFEVLYPTDVNQTAFNRAINYPASWTPAALTALKTEAFGFTLGRDLDQSIATIHFGDALGFTAAQRSHLVGVGDATTAWMKEARIAAGMRFESVVLFALDQFCLIGYPDPLPVGLRRGFRTGR
jgi:hypothetical protein